MNTWTDYPHASVLISMVINLVKPLNKGTRICDPIIFERKEAFNSGNFEPFNTFKVRVGVDEDAIVMCICIPPEWTCTDLFMSHAPDPAGITGGIERRCRRIEDVNTPIMSRAAGSWDILRVAGVIREELREKEVTDQASQVW